MLIKELEWSLPAKPNDKCRYDHVTATTPFGDFSIEWKSWKLYDPPCVYFNGEYILDENSLECAKSAASAWWKEKVSKTFTLELPEDPGPEYSQGAYSRRNIEAMARDLALRTPSIASTKNYQQNVDDWIIACFGEEVRMDKIERNYRFLEEALELVQACEMDRNEAHQLVDYVFDREPGDKIQESGGVSTTHAALCTAQRIDMDTAAKIELARIWTKIEKIREKQKNKPRFGPLPQEYKASVGTLLNYTSATVRLLVEKLDLYEANYQSNTGTDAGRRQVIQAIREFLQRRAQEGPQATSPLDGSRES